MKPNLNSPEFMVAIVIIGTLLCFFLYYYIAHSGFLKKIALRYSTEIQQKIALFFFRKLTGFIFMGIIPAVLYYSFKGSQLPGFGLTYTHFISNFPLILILAAIIISILFINQKFNTEFNTLQIKTKNWTTPLFAFNAFGWIIYLIAYEFLFRGILLFECNAVLGFWPAVAINISIYAAVHMVNGKDQAIGALIFGTIACYFTLTRGTILIPIFMHITLSLTADFFSIRLQRINYKLQKKNIKILRK